MILTDQIIQTYGNILEHPMQKNSADFNAHYDTYCYNRHTIKFKASAFVNDLSIIFVRSTRTSHSITQDQFKNKIVNTVKNQNSNLVMVWAKMM